MSRDAEFADERVIWRVDPSHLDGPLDLELAVGARAGEAYLIAAPVFAYGEALESMHCDEGELRAADVVAHLDAVGLPAEWTVLDAAPGAAYSSETSVDTIPDGEVIWGYANTATTMQLTFLPDDASLDPALSVPRVPDLPFTTSLVIEDSTDIQV